LISGAVLAEVPSGLYLTKKMMLLIGGESALVIAHSLESYEKTVNA
jgi:hypothetical protein